jgi:VIT1/CCC1 family predicted Fe2+/Mn2+ transporter
MEGETLTRVFLGFQKNEITEHHVYRRLARRVKGENRRVLERISQDELRHYHVWRELSGQDVSPCRWRIFFYTLVAWVLGLTFAIKIMERHEDEAEKAYAQMVKDVPQAEEILKDEFEHEKLLVGMIREERVAYVGSMVLGLNDALVELTGSLAGLTFALQKTKVIGMAGVIMGIAATLSMMASEYLSQKSEGGDKNPFKASFYTGLAYLFTVFLLVAPYFIFSHYLLALLVAVTDAVIVIYLFSFFVSVVKDEDFKGRFIEMLAISMGVAVVSFAIGLLARRFLGVDI